MTRIAVLADIHGNIPALEAVVRDIEAQRVDEVLVGGDLVGRGPQGSKAIQRVRELAWPSVRGNHEDYLLTFRRGEIPADWLEADEWSASRWMAAELSENDIAYMESLPFALQSLRLPQIRLVHASPRSNNDAIGPWTSRRRMQRHLDSIAESVLVCGHTHRPLQEIFDQGQVVNAGSVGLPFNQDQRAQYVVFDDTSGETKTEFHQVEYDLAEIFEIYESSGFGSHGGVTAKLLALELQHAQPFLVPFLQWSAALQLAPIEEQIENFRAFYDPDEPIGSFSARLEGLIGRDNIG